MMPETEGSLHLLTHLYDGRGGRSSIQVTRDKQDAQDRKRRRRSAHHTRYGKTNKTRMESKSNKIRESGTAVPDASTMEGDEERHGETRKKR